MLEKKKRGMLGDIVLGLLVKIPLWSAKKGVEYFHQIESFYGKCVLIGVGFILFLLGILGFRSVFEMHLLRNMFHSSRGWIGLAILYVSYVFSSLPFCTPYAWMSGDMKQKIIKEKKKKKLAKAEIKPEENEKEILIGKSFWTGKNIYLKDSMRLMHTHVVGSTGSGKTESVLLTFLRQDIALRRGAIIVDGKGDLELYGKLKRLLKESGREDDLLYFSLSNPDESNTYNPLIIGDEVKIKDKIIGATEWGEEFYKKRAEEALLILIGALLEKKERVSFKKLYGLLTDQKKLLELKDSFPESDFKSDLEILNRGFGENAKYLSGLIADLSVMSKAKFSRLVNSEHPEINLEQVYQNGRIVYFSLDTQGYEETARRFGRLVLQDIKAFSNYLQSKHWEGQRKFFPIYIDEFSSFVFDSFIELLNKARASKFALMMLHQSMGDLAVKRETYLQQVIENTNIKIIMRQDDPTSVERLAKIGGAEKTLIPTLQTQEGVLGKELTGLGSIREGETFKIDPDLIRALERGEAIVVTKFPSFQIDYVNLDYSGNIKALKAEAPLKGRHENPEVPTDTLYDKTKAIQAILKKELDQKLKAS